jgi:molybdate transport system substrate-binding protein
MTAAPWSARRPAAVAACILLVTGCGGTAAASLDGTSSITVFAAASLSTVFSSSGGAVLASDGVTPRFTFGGSQQLVQNVIDGAPADVVATADTVTMQRLVSANLVLTPRIFARNEMEIAVARGNPKHIASLADLARHDVLVVLAAPSVPAGDYAAEVLRKASVTVHPMSFELDVEAALEKVASGDADAAIVYRTDVATAAGHVDGIPIPAGDNVVAAYPIAVVRSTASERAAMAFVQSAMTGALHQALLRAGFLPP